MRLDVYLAENGFAKSRTRAQELINGGFVTVNGKAATKASLAIEAGDDVSVTGETHPFVSRGGMKLEGALSAFQIDVSGLTAVDIGASSGGFTDCLLRRGAKKVYAVDSGSDQLDPSLVADSRVINIEHFNARELSSEHLGELCDIAVCDLSFISQTYILPILPLTLKSGGIYVGLIKPQFECGPSAIGKHGIVTDKRHHKSAIDRVITCLKDNSLTPVKLAVSPIEGGDGNREFLIYAVYGEAKCEINEKTVNEVVAG